MSEGNYGNLTLTCKNNVIAFRKITVKFIILIWKCKTISQFFN